MSKRGAKSPSLHWYAAPAYVILNDIQTIPVMGKEPFECV